MGIDQNATNKLPSNVTGSGGALPKKWFAVYVRLYHEKKISERLTRMGIENFLPLQEEIHRWSDRLKKIERVLIPMLVFVRVDAKERLKVLTLPSVNGYMVLRGESTPAVIPDEQMERFRFMLDYSEKAVHLSPEPLTPGEKVRVIKGKLAGLEGELVTIGKKTKIVVRIDILGCALVDIPVSYVERIS